MSSRKAMIAGSTGLVGSFLLEHLLSEAEGTDPLYEEIRTLVRRPTDREHPRLHEHVVDFDRLEETRAELFDVDDLFCCLGTTIKKAGSEEAFRRVDQVYVESLAGLARDQGARRLILISSIGADPSVSNFYLRVKGEVERNVSQLGFSEVHLLRPSLLLGDRAESRPAERAGIFVSKLGAPLLIGPMRHFRPVHARIVAAAMLGAAHSGRDGRHAYTYDEIAELAASIGKIRECE